MAKTKALETPVTPGTREGEVAAPTIEEVPPFTNEQVQVARSAYLAWGATLGYKDMQGDDLPKWAQLPMVLREAWCNASIAAQADTLPEVGVLL